MECEEVRESLSAFLDGELNEHEREAVRAHVERCSDCARELAALQQVSALYRRLEDPEPPVDLEERVFAEVGRFRASKVPFWTRSSFPSSPKPILAVAASVLVICGAAVITARLISSRQPVKLAKTAPEQAAPVMQLDAERAAADMKSVPGKPEVTPADFDALKEKAAETKTGVAGVELGAKPERGDLLQEEPSVVAGTGSRSADEQIGREEVLSTPTEVFRARPESARGGGVADVKAAAGVAREEVPVAERDARHVLERSEYGDVAVSSKPVSAPGALVAGDTRDSELAVPSPAAAAMPQEAGETPLVEYEMARVQQEGNVISSTHPEGGDVIRGIEQVSLSDAQRMASAEVVSAPTSVAERGHRAPEMYRFAYESAIPIGRTFTVPAGPEAIPVPVTLISIEFERRSVSNVDVAVAYTTGLTGRADRGLEDVVPASVNSALVLHIDTGEGKAVQVHAGDLKLDLLPAADQQEGGVSKAGTTINVENLAGARMFSIELKPVESETQTEDEYDD